MKEVRIRNVSNGYIVEYWSTSVHKPPCYVPYGWQPNRLELNCIEVYQLYGELQAEVEKYFEKGRANKEVKNK